MPKRKSDAGNGDAQQKPKLNRTSSDFESLDFNSECSTKSGKKWNFKISSWNVDGLRAWTNKGGHEFIKHESSDVICLQETKCSESKVPDCVRSLDDYPHQYWINNTENEGQSGVGLLCKAKPLKVEFGIKEKEFDKEGRLITAEFETFFLINVYVPNAGRKLVTLDKRMRWDPLLRAYLKQLDEKKPVILCGDLNVAHKEIDLANPKTNKKNAGFTQEERDGFDALLDEGFVDSFRHFNSDKEKCYTFWTYLGNCRAKNVGWRLDYFVVSKRMLDNQICDNVIRDQVFGSDHCPSTLFMVAESK